ncbi:phosphoribosyltransferase family protein [Bacillus massiliigorillae]|uniref:phosphoribosyltransferase family protein n=1 Tax=Bacillus massiliigorillae TaxID=1243664 RepID=UPI0003A05FFD|nr:phosphoribosyltransferase family protein [Bacillus massiliigorillae]
MKVAAFSEQEIHHILDNFQVQINIHSNPYNIPLHQLFQMAARINTKRSFLFVSKILGKHLAVKPLIPLLTGTLLAMRYKEIVHGEKDERAQVIATALQSKQNLYQLQALIENEPIPLAVPITIIGFAETATALGHAVFHSFNNNASYIHTTRENIQNLSSSIHFEEEHSHATSHRVYALDDTFLKNNQEIVLVDDEITTGKTALNIIRTLKEYNPTKKVFSIVSILDWRTAEHREQYRQLEKELNITIHVISLIEGNITINGTPTLAREQKETISSTQQEITFIPLYEHMEKDNFLPFSSTSENQTKHPSPYLKSTGRFGLTKEEDILFSNQCCDLAQYVANYRKGTKSLVIGTGEFMYIPMKIASEMGNGIYYQSTTRSPIYQTEHETYSIRSKFTFESPENPGVTNHLYNIESSQYDDVFIFIERLSTYDHIHSLIEELKRTHIPHINIVVMTKAGEDQ